MTRLRRFSCGVTAIRASRIRPAAAGPPSPVPGAGPYSCCCPPRWRLPRRAAIRAVLHRVLIKPFPPGANANVAGNSKNKALRREREMAVLRQRVEFDWRV